MNYWKPLALVSMGTVAIILSCGGDERRPGVAPARAGQPHMEAAVNHLNAARRELEVAEHNKGGHRDRAIQLTDQAINEVNQGMAIADR
jgi:hypothetical protein